MKRMVHLPSLNPSRWAIARVIPALAAATFLAIGAVGCGPGDTGTDAGTDGGDTDPPPDCDIGACKRNIDCEAGAVCEKPEGAGVDDWGCCLKILCTEDADCEDTEVCDQRRGLCVPADLCDPGFPEGKCQPGEFCIYQNGDPQCVDGTELPVPDTCTLSPNPVFIRDGETVSLTAVGQLDSGALTPNAVFDYAAGGGVGTIAAGTGNLAATCDGPDPCSGTVTASSGGASCVANVTVYPTVPDGDARVVLFDSQAGAPIVGATVAIRAGGVLVDKPTGANGDATFTAGELAGAIEAASAFPSAHVWQSVMSPSTNDIAFFTVPVPVGDDQKAGVKGTFDFDNVSTQGDIKLGLAGMSIRSSLVDSDFALLLGEIADYPIELEGVTNGEQDVPLPSGLVIELGQEPIKPDFVAFGDPGNRILWALGGKVRLADIGPIISSVTASDDINVGSILSAVLPFFAKFDHAVVAGLLLDNKTVPVQEDPLTYDQYPFQELTGDNAVNLNTLLSQNATYNIPNLPCASGAVTAGGCDDLDDDGIADYQSGAILLTGVIVPGQGIVPLGLTAGLDDPDDADGDDEVDGVLDYKDPGGAEPARGQAILDYAPPHDGLEGNPYITIAIALDIDGLVDGGLQASTLLHVTDGFGTGTNSFPPASFLEQQGGTFDDTAATFTLDAVGTADFYRLNMSTNGEEWNVYFEDDPGAQINLNDLRPATVTGRTAAADVQAFKLGNGWRDDLTFEDLIEFNGTNIDDNFAFYLGGWVSTACENSVDGSTPFCLEQ